MKVVADLHLHSKYSRAVSPQMTLPVMATYALEKGLQLLTASDWTHPVWFKEISSLLEQAGEGVYKLKSPISNFKSQINTNNVKDPLFILSTEISSIYKQDGKLRRIHNLVFVSSLEKAEKFTDALVSRGCNVNADGRPIVGLTAKQLLELLLEIDEKGFVIPCHVWTPHFGLYGSASGFDSIEEAFGDLSEYIYGIETGISSDPEMNWEIAELKNRSILSFSDAHSPAKMGREATVLELENIDFPSLKRAIMRPSVIASEQSERGNLKIASLRQAQGELPRNDKNHILYTVEFYPEEGKYHYSGHRNCKVSLSPEQIATNGVICPVCQRKVTEGVFIRLAQLAGKNNLASAKVTERNGVRWLEDPDQERPGFVKLVPLLEIIAEAMHVSVASKKVKEKYSFVIKTLGAELDILLNVPLETIALKVGERIAEGIARVRQGELIIEPGYDGEYGVVKLWTEGSKQSSIVAPQMKLDL